MIIPFFDRRREGGAVDGLQFNRKTGVSSLRNGEKCNKKHNKLTISALFFKWQVVNGDRGQLFSLFTEGGRAAPWTDSTLIKKQWVRNLGNDEKSNNKHKQTHRLCLLFVSVKW